jgi:hypothetical protein
MDFNDISPCEFLVAAGFDPTMFILRNALASSKIMNIMRCLRLCGLPADIAAMIMVWGFKLSLTHRMLKHVPYYSGSALVPFVSINCNWGNNCEGQEYTWVEEAWDYAFTVENRAFSPYSRTEVKNGKRHGRYHLYIQVNEIMYYDFWATYVDGKLHGIAIMHDIQHKTNHIMLLENGRCKYLKTTYKNDLISVFETYDDYTKYKNNVYFWRGKKWVLDIHSEGDLNESMEVPRKMSAKITNQFSQISRFYKHSKVLFEGIDVLNCEKMVVSYCIKKIKINKNKKKHIYSMYLIHVYNKDIYGKKFNKNSENTASYTIHEWELIDNFVVSHSE